MKLFFKRENILAGRNKVVELNVDFLPPAQQQTVRKLFLSEPEPQKCKPCPLARELFRYTLQISGEAGILTMVFDDLSVPEEARQLVHFLNGKAV